MVLDWLWCGIRLGRRILWIQRCTQLHRFCPVTVFFDAASYIDLYLLNLRWLRLFNDKLTCYVTELDDAAVGLLSLAICMTTLVFAMQLWLCTTSLLLFVCFYWFSVLIFRWPKEKCTSSSNDLREFITSMALESLLGIVLRVSAFLVTAVRIFSVSRLASIALNWWFRDMSICLDAAVCPCDDSISFRSNCWCDTVLTLNGTNGYWCRGDLVPRCVLKFVLSVFTCPVRSIWLRGV